jgi:hypothetical protein
MHQAPVDTRFVKGRRAVSLETIDELEAEVDRIMAAATEGKLKTLGNWSAGQILWHIGRLIEFSIDGFPFCYRRGLQWLTPILRWISWRCLISLAFRPGFRNPSEAAALEPDPAIALDAAAGYLRQQIGRIRSGERMTKMCSLDGAYSHEQWIYIQLRHAELHLSYLALTQGNE